MGIEKNNLPSLFGENTCLNLGEILLYESRGRFFEKPTWDPYLIISTKLIDKNHRERVRGILLYIDEGVE